MAAKRKIPRLFEPGDTVRCSVTGKLFVIERVDDLVNERYFLRSLESGNPGNPKNRYFLNNQIEDGFLVKE